MRCAKRLARAFALYEVLLGLAIFSVGVLVLGRSVENCLNASTFSAEQERVRQILSNRMSEIQTSPGLPDTKKETKIDTGHGEVTLIQRSEPANLKDEKDLEMNGIIHVTLSVEWTRGRNAQSKKLEFYVYRNG
jgi:Tfp pilus assembly protein PilV